MPAAQSFWRKEIIELIRESLLRKINDTCEPAGINFTVTSLSSDLILLMLFVLQG
jgi:hypothetical protein